MPTSAAQIAQAQALRNYQPAGRGATNYAPAGRGATNYAANPFAAAGLGGGVQVGAMAPHLSQPMPIDADIAAAYKEFMTDPRAKQYEQYGMDLDRIWRASPNASIFKPGYAHNQYVLARAEELRAGRLPQPAEGSGIPARFITDAGGNEIINPEYQTWLTGRQERDGSD